MEARVNHASFIADRSAFAADEIIHWLIIPTRESGKILENEIVDDDRFFARVAKALTTKHFGWKHFKLSGFWVRLVSREERSETCRILWIGRKQTRQSSDAGLIHH